MSNQKTETIVLMASAARTATTTVSPGEIGERFDECLIFQNVTAASGTNETWDTVIQISPDGTNWLTHTTFTQATGVTHEYKALTNFGGWIRAVSTLAGTDTPTFTGTLTMVGKRAGGN